MFFSCPDLPLRVGKGGENFKHAEPGGEHGLYGGWVAAAAVVADEPRQGAGDGALRLGQALNRAGVGARGHTSARFFNLLNGGLIGTLLLISINRTASCVIPYCFPSCLKDHPPVR